VSSDAVAIVVIDDFKPPAETGDLSFPATGECVISSRGAQVAGGKGANGGTLTDGVSHGSLVSGEIDHELHSSGYTAQNANFLAQYGLDPSWNWVKRVGLYANTKKPAAAPILVVAVDTDDYLAATVSDHITKLVSNLTLPKFGEHIGPIDRFVLDMSFEVAPCDSIKGSIEVGPQRLRLARYLEMAKTVPDLAGLERQLTQMVGTSEPNLQSQLDATNGPAAQIDDALRRERNSIIQSVSAEGKSTFNQYLDSLVHSTRKKKVIPVAAAGNGLGKGQPSLAFPFAPGIWNSVVSVSSEPDWSVNPDDPGTSEFGTAMYSNSGEVMLSGILPLQDLDTSEPFFTGRLNSVGPEDMVYGTSFAAARLSVQEAFYLLNDGSVDCAGNPHSVPPLGYHDSDPSAPYQWSNLTPLAATRYCTDFERLAVAP
jgi:hypothetical protein